MPLDELFVADLELVLEDRRRRPGKLPQGRSLKGEAMSQLDGAAVRNAVRQAHGNPDAAREEIARQLLNARLMVPARGTDDNDALLALVAGGAMAVVLFGMVTGEVMPGMVASAMVAAVLAWALWQRWGPRSRNVKGRRRP
jgi:hypothetical protein